TPLGLKRADVPKTKETMSYNVTNYLSEKFTLQPDTPLIQRFGGAMGDGLLPVIRDMERSRVNNSEAATINPGSKSYVFVSLNLPLPRLSSLLTMHCNSGLTRVWRCGYSWNPDCPFRLLFPYYSWYSSTWMVSRSSTKGSRNSLGAQSLHMRNGFNCINQGRFILFQRHHRNYKRFKCHRPSRN